MAEGRADGGDQFQFVDGDDMSQDQFNFVDVDDMQNEADLLADGVAAPDLDAGLSAAKADGEDGDYAGSAGGGDDDEDGGTEASFDDDGVILDIGQTASELRELQLDGGIIDESADIRDLQDEMGIAAKL